MADGRDFWIAKVQQTVECAHFMYQSQRERQSRNAANPMMPAPIQ
jgi:hypothetical protein